MNSETRELAGRAVRKLRSGAALSDEELRAGIEVLSVLVPCLRELGLMYHLPYSALLRALDELKGFLHQRQEGAITPVYLNSWTDDWGKIEDEVEKDIPCGWTSKTPPLVAQQIVPISPAVAEMNAINRNLADHLKKKGTE